MTTTVETATRPQTSSTKALNTQKAQLLEQLVPAPQHQRPGAASKAAASPLTVYWWAGKVTLRPVPLRRSQTENPISFKPPSTPSVKRSRHLRVAGRVRPPVKGYEPASAVTCGEAKRVRLPFKVVPMKV
jgi:hypothetical protein